jgi:ribosomal protein S18 acetylase RimI-like enzyme
MTWFGIDAEKRRQGLGKQFVALLAAHLIAQGFRWLHLDTAAENIGAQPFYESLGCRSLGKTRSFVRR